MIVFTYIRSYLEKAKNAQEAHEAIRPTDINKTPSSLRSILDRDQIKLYELIWNRTVASQMESAEFERTIVDISNETKNTSFRANGSVEKFDGFLKIYKDIKEEDNKDKEEEDNQLPKLSLNESLKIDQLINDQHLLNLLDIRS